MKSLLLFVLLLDFSFIRAQLPEKPNILLIVIDDLNDYQGAFGGHPQISTPNIDNLASEGLRFVNANANCPGCAPSRTSMLSGKDALYTQVFHNGDYLINFRDNFTVDHGNETVYSFPELLKDSGGYYTFAINKVFHNPNNNDFDKDTPDPCYKGKSWNRMVNFEDTETFVSQSESYSYLDYFAFGAIPNVMEDDMVDYLAADTAIQFLQDFASGSTSTCDRPFMLAIGFKRPHVDRFIPEHYYPDWFLENLDSLPYPYPYNLPFNQFPPNGFIMPPQPNEADYADYEQLVAGGMGEYLADNGDFLEDLDLYIGTLSEYPIFEETLTDSMRLEILENSIKTAYVINYFAAVQFIDAQVGRVLDELNDHPSLAENTVVVLVSDHGYSLGEKKHFGKWVLWETVNRIPMVIKGPGIPADSVNSPVSLLDVFPTMMDLAGEELPTFPDGSAYLDGKSLLPFIENPNRNINHPSLQIYKRGSGKGSCFPQLSVRNNRYHLINYRENNDGSIGTGICDGDTIIYEKELYDIGINREIDPEEWNNLAEDPDYTPLINYLTQMFPDSALYKKPHYSIEFFSKSFTCLTDEDATIHLIPKIYANHGGLMAGTLLNGIKFTWTHSLGTDTINTRILDFPLSDIPEVLLSSSDDLFFYLHITDSTTNELLGFNQYKVALHPDTEPDASFSVVVNDHKAYVYDAEITGVFTAFNWNIDNLYTTNAPLPAPYEIADPDVHQVILKVQYGNQCYKEVVRSFTDLPGISLEQTPNSTKLYPNPAGTNVWLKCSLAINQFVLTDMQGRNMQLNWQLVADGLFLLESKGLSPGNYLITGTGPEGRISCLWQVRKEE